MRSRLVVLTAALVVVTAAPATGSVERYAGEARAGGAQVDIDHAHVAVSASEAGIDRGWGPHAAVQPSCGLAWMCATAMTASAGAADESVHTRPAKADPDDPGPNEVTGVAVPGVVQPTVDGHANSAWAEVAPVPERARGHSDGAALALNARTPAARQALADTAGEVAGLAALTVGSSQSTTEETQGVTRARATGSGGRLVIAPRREPDRGEDVGGAIVIDVTGGTATATADRLEDATTADAEAAVARVRVWDPRTDVYHEVEVGPDQEPVTVAEGTPLETTIHPATTSIDHSVSVPVVGASPEVWASATAHGVRVEAFQAPLPQAVVTLGRAHAGAGGESEPTPPLP